MRNPFHKLMRRNALTETLPVTDLISTLHRVLLRRRPDAGELAANAELAANGQLDTLLESYLKSDEFRPMKHNNDERLYYLNFDTSMGIDFDLDPLRIDKMWRHISKVWNAYGENDAIWSVITDPRLKTESQPSPEAIDEFYAAGKGDVNYLSAFLTRAGLAISRFPVAAEYGCGVGRVTRWLAPQFSRLLAFDISKPHIDLARQYLEGQNVSNVDFVHVANRKDLDALRGIDLFFSLIVLQHNPPPLIFDILENAFRGLNPGGIAFFQVPTYSSRYDFKMDRYLEDQEKIREMEIHFLSQRAIFELGMRYNVHPLEVREDQCIGETDRWISNTFLMRKAS